MNIMKRAAQIRRASGNKIKMTSAVKKAAAELKGKKRKTKTAKRRVVKKSAPVKRRVVKKSAPRTRKTVASLTASAKKLLVADIASLEARKFVTAKKTAKRKLAKKIAEKKRSYRKLS